MIPVGFNLKNGGDLCIRVIELMREKEWSLEDRSAVAMMLGLGLGIAASGADSSEVADFSKSVLEAISRSERTIN